MKKLTLLFFVFHFSFFTFHLSEAQVIHVPGTNNLTIQEGIELANPGDTVLVSDGTYDEQINFLGKKPLVVASEFLIDGDSSHISNTIITKSQFPNPDSASIVYFVSGEDTTSILCGFTITGGRGTTIYSPEYWGVAREGGGIWISGSGAKIRNNIIKRNRCQDVLLPNIWSDVGGGIATDIEQDDIWIIIENNVIDSNYVLTDSTFGCTGAGIAIFNNCRIINNIIKNNVGKSVINLDYWTQGAGAMVFSPPEWDKVAIIKNNQFLNNTNNSNNAFGGGMKVMSMHLTCMNNAFIGNRVESDISITDCWGAGVEAGNFLGGSVISGNTFKDNYSEKSDAGLMIFSQDTIFDKIIVENNYFLDNIAAFSGGALTSYECPVILQNNVFSGNHAGNYGGALVLRNTTGVPVDHLATLISNSFYGNVAGSNGGAIYSISANPLIFNCIFWQDSAYIGQEIFINAQSSAEIAWSDIDIDKIWGPYTAGDGIMNEDPQFDDQDLLTLSIASPCINTGTESYTCQCGTSFLCPEQDILGISRPQNGLFDIGAYEVCFAGITKPIVINRYSSAVCYPNPLKNSTTIEYELENYGTVKLEVLNNVGQEIVVLVNEQQAKGKHQVRWNAEGFQAGIYFYRLAVGGQRSAVSGKIIKF